MTAIFKDQKLQDHFVKYGYVTVPLLSADEVKRLSQFLEEQKAYTSTGAFHSTHFSTDYTHKKTVHDTLNKIVSPVVERFLSGYRIAFSNFMIKHAGGNNPMPLHADWTYVKEPANTSIAIWIPLVDTTDQNGHIGVIPFSHHLSPLIRGPRIDQWNAPTGETLIEKMGKLLPLNAGYALIYNHRLLHYSPPNNSTVDRPAINLSLVPLATPVFHYCVPETTDQIHEFAVESDDFFLRYNNFQMPETGKLLAKHPILLAPMIDGQTMEFIDKYRSESWWQRAKKQLLS